MNPKQELDFKLARISQAYDIDLLLALKTHPKMQASRDTIDALPLPLFQISTRLGSPFAAKLSENTKQILESTWFIDKYITEEKAKNVLELGAGSNGGSLFLSWKYPHVHFSRLCSFEGKLAHELNKYRGVSNYNSIPGSMEKLDMFKSGSFDIVFSVETLSLVEKREDVFRSVRGVLRDGGVFVVVDGYLGNAPGSLSREELIVRHLVGRGKALKEFETYDDFLAQAVDEQYRVVFEADVSDQAMPALKYFELQSSVFFNHPLLAKIHARILSAEASFRLISNYLMPTAIRMGMAQYKVTVMRK
jgi:SAM-dependent methyltransferase